MQPGLRTDMFTYLPVPLRTTCSLRSWLVERPAKLWSRIVWPFLPDAVKRMGRLSNLARISGILLMEVRIRLLVASSTAGSTDAAGRLSWLKRLTHGDRGEAPGTFQS